MPGRLATAAGWNPVSRTAAAVRHLSGVPGAESGRAGAAILWLLVLLAVFLPPAVRRFARLSR